MNEHFVPTGAGWLQPFVEAGQVGCLRALLHGAVLLEPAMRVRGWVISRLSFEDAPKDIRFANSSLPVSCG